jgi:hypothetical protein
VLLDTSIGKKPSLSQDSKGNLRRKRRPEDVAGKGQANQNPLAMIWRSMKSHCLILA